MLGAEPSFEELVRYPPNSAILTCPLDDEEEKMSQHYPIINLRGRWKIGRLIPEPQLQRMYFMFLVRRWRDLDSSLPAPQKMHEYPRLRDIYAITTADLTPRATTQSLLHWSIYCDGYVYHLGADSASQLYSAPSSSYNNKDKDVPSRFKVDKCFLDSSDPAGRAFAAKHWKPLVAYHIGQTDLDHAHIKDIGDWLIGHMKSYNYISSNCQHFLIILALRIISRRRRFTVFLGTLAQIARWDNVQRVTGSEQHSSGYLHGFLLRGPQDPYPDKFFGRRLEMFLEQTRVEGRAYHIHHLWPALATDNPPPRNIADYPWWRRQLLIWPLIRQLVIRRGDRQTRQSLEDEGIYVVGV